MGPSESHLVTSGVESLSSELVLASIYKSHLCNDSQSHDYEYAIFFFSPLRQLQIILLDYTQCKNNVR